MRFARLLLLLGVLLLALPAASAPAIAEQDEAAGARTATPIKHLVVIYQENVSFDHYFGTYPTAANFHPSSRTPNVNGLNDPLLLANPNKSAPQLLSRSQAHTCDMNHDYTAEQKAHNHGAMDRFVEEVNNTTLPAVEKCAGTASGKAPNYTVMDYYDGTTVTALWNYAQHFAMSDNSFSTGYGPSTPGALNLIAGNTFGAICTTGTGEAFNAPGTCPAVLPSAQGPGTITGDPQPLLDTCSTPTTRAVAAMGGTNVGDLLNAKQVTWGWFQGGFDDCKHSSGTAIGATARADYIPHHQPFQYYQSTANPKHLPPSSAQAIGKQDQANHQYDLQPFWTAAEAGRLPAVSFLKAPAYQDGHAGYSTPLDEQHFLVDTINRLQRLPSWRSTAVIIAYDDSDGWYDHVMPPVVNESQAPKLDALTAPDQCGAKLDKVPGAPKDPQQARCGYGPRQPLLLISPFAKRNFVDHSLTDQSSILRFIEDNWDLGRVGKGSVDWIAGPLNGMFDFAHPSEGRLILDAQSGQPAAGEPGPSD
jgi:phospholipase C